ncbi:MAG: hypothetical protein KF810_06000 [Rhizobiaceae bacterium]|nr:hypothetical protein [Rhizobiaceae bacterium]
MLGALLAWEHGGGMGHIVTLKTVAEAVDDRFTFDAALCDLTHAGALSGLCTPVQGPWLPLFEDDRKARGSPPRATWGEFLGDVGFRRPEILRESIGWWQGVMRECDISLVIADCAPCALMAARGLGIPSVAISTGYLTPPPAMPRFPILLSQHSTCIYDEAETLEIVNSVVTEFGVPELAGLPEVYQATDQIIFSIDMLDPYAAWRAMPSLPPMMGGEVGPVSDGDEIFVYLSNAKMADPAFIEAIGNIGRPVRLFIPKLDPSLAASFSSLNIRVERAAVPVNLIAKRSRLIVSAAQHGITCLGIASGLPQVSRPSDLEKQYNAEAVERRGIMQLIDDKDLPAHLFRSTILNAYEDAAMARRARALADELRSQFDINQRKMIRRRIADVMDNRI